MFVRGNDGELIILTWIPAMRPTASATRYLPYSITRAQCDVTRHRCRHGRNHCDGHCVCSCCLCLLACCVCSVIVSYTGSERLLWIVRSILPFLANICLHSQSRGMRVRFYHCLFSYLAPCFSPPFSATNNFTCACLLLLLLLLLFPVASIHIELSPLARSHFSPNGFLLLLPHSILFFCTIL